jgi:L-rhamnose mutarotase
MRVALHVAWQARMAELLDVVHDYGAEAAGLAVVWEV